MAKSFFLVLKRGKRERGARPCFGLPKKKKRGGPYQKRGGNAREGKRKERGYIQKMPT